MQKTNAQDKAGASADRLVGLVFSKDRAMQLCAALEAFFARCRDHDRIRLYVLYRVSDAANRRQYEALSRQFDDVCFVEERSFKRQTLEIVASADHILFLVDDNLFVRDFTLAAAVDALSNHPDAIGFSLRLGRNTVHNYSRDVRMTLPDFTEAGSGMLKYNWTRQQHDFGYPLEISSSIYRTTDVLPLLEQLDFANPNLLEGLMAANARLYAARLPYLLCFDLSVAFCNPLNMVQTVCINRTGGDSRYSASNLAALFDDGYRIDVAQYNGLIPCGCHQDMELSFRRSDEQTPPDLPLVTVEIVTYNCERFIRKAIASVLAQTYTNIEVIVLDDGGADGTPDIVASFNDHRLRYVRAEHKGRWAQTNRVISEAKGSFIIAVDSDDYIAPNYIERMVAAAVQYPDVDFFYPAELYLVDENNCHTGVRWCYDDFSDNRILPHVLFERGNSPIPYPGSLRRMSMFERTGTYEELPNVADFAFLCRNALKIRFARVDRHARYFYRRLNHSLSRKAHARDCNTARLLHEMVSYYPPELICPKLADVPDMEMRKRLCCVYLKEVFYRHADAVKFGEYFRRYGDHYRTQLEILQDRPSAGSLTGSI